MNQTPAAVEFQTGDGITLRGLQWDGGSSWLIFVHDCDGESDLDGWRPLVAALLDDDWSMLAFDLRGHGASDGEWDETDIAGDLMAALRFAQTRGATWTAVLAAGQSAVAALRLASDNQPDALVLLSPALTEETPPGTLRGKGDAKLFAVGGKDLALQQAVSRLRNTSIGWAMLVTVPTDAQGTGLLADRLASQVIERIVAFLKEQRYLAGVRGMAPARQAGSERPAS